MDKKIIDYLLKGDKVRDVLRGIYEKKFIEDVNKESALYEEYLIGLMPLLGAVKLDEIRMSWVIDHIRSNDTCGVVSAFNGHDHKLDMANHERLKKHVRKLGHGFVELEETWKEGKERSLFVPGMSRENTTSIGKHFKQDTVIHKDKDHFHMYNPRTGDVDKEYSKSDPVTFAKDAVKDFSSRLIKGGHRKKEWAFQPEKQPIGFRLRERESYQKLRWTAAPVTLGWLTIYDENEPDPNECYRHVWEVVGRGRGSNEIRRCANCGHEAEFVSGK